MWMSAQGLFGNVFTGSDTDPNTGPLVILLAAAMAPTVVAAPWARNWRPPAAVAFRRFPALATLLAVGIGAGLALAATYPPAAPESAGSAMSGMEMGGSSGAASGSDLVGASTCQPNQVGLKIAGLDLANTPYMIMSGTHGMDLNGADASAAAGLNTTKVGWHYTGPALPASLANLLMQDGNNGPAYIHMALSGCAHGVTSSQQIGAEQYVQQTSAAVSGYTTPAEAMAAGYEPASPTNYPVVAYVNPAIVAADKRHGGRSARGTSTG